MHIYILVGQLNIFLLSHQPVWFKSGAAGLVSSLRQTLMYLLEYFHLILETSTKFIPVIISIFLVVVGLSPHLAGCQRDLFQPPSFFLILSKLCVCICVCS